MKIFARQILSIVFCFFGALTAGAQTIQIPAETMLEIVRAEDELRFDNDLAQLLKSSDAAVRRRAALAAGRTGSAKAVAPLAEMLAKDADQETRAIVVFALGEIENIAAANSILKVLNDANQPNNIRARALEAAGKIAAANAKNPLSIELGEKILDVLEAEHLKTAPDQATVLLGLTAVLRAKPNEAAFVVAKFLSSRDARVRADALNTMARLRVKNDDLNGQFRALLLSDDDPIVRANAARAAGAAEDATALELLVEAAISDDDSRVRASAIRAVANLNNKKAAAPLLDRAEKLFAAYKTAKTKKIANPTEENELLEIAATLGKLLQNSNDERAVKLLTEFRVLDSLSSPETEIALAQIAPDSYTNQVQVLFGSSPTTIKLLESNEAIANWQRISNVAQGLNALANIESKNRDAAFVSTTVLRALLNSDENLFPQAIPEVLRAYSALKDEDLPKFLNNKLKAKDVIVRATAAELLGEQSFDRKNLNALADAFRQADQNDQMNDAALAALDAFAKQAAQIAANDFISAEIATNLYQAAAKSPDYLVRRKAAEILKRKNPQLDASDLETVRFPETAKPNAFNANRVVRTNYLKAISRKNGATKAVVTTDKNVFTIDLLPEDAPLTVDNFVRLARANRFDNTIFHRVVPNFVVQGGDFERGDGSGSPGYAIRDEINLRSYERGAVGMALSGKDTGGSQWFVTHSPQPHLDGGYTIFGFVDEAGMKIIDNIARGDRILSIKIIENNAPQPRPKARTKNARSKLN